MSFSFPFLRSKKNRIIGEIKPNIKAVRMVTIILNISVSSAKANIVKTIIVNDGGTNRIEMSRANLLAKLSDSVFKQFL
jgi:hypothetical protein